MRVAFLVHEFPCLSETFVVNQAIGLIDRGCEVDIYAARINSAEKVHPAVEQYGLCDRTYQLPPVPNNYAARILRAIFLVLQCGLTHPRRLLSALNLFSRGWRALSLWSLFYAMPKAMPDVSWPRYDIIHCQFGNLGFHGRVMQDWCPESRLVLMFRGFDISQHVQQSGDRTYETLLAHADLCLTNCEFFRQRLLAMGSPPERTLVHFSGLDCEKYPFAIRQLPEDGKIRLASTGRLVEKKGFEYCIRAIAQLLPDYPELTYDIIGEGPLRSHLQSLIDSLNLQDTVRLLGWRTETEIIDHLRETHLFLAPSVTSQQGNQDAPVNVLKEAMAMGIPVVSTQHGGIPELVENGVSGILVPEKDECAISQALRQLLTHPERWPAMGQAGRAYVAAHYDLKSLNDRLVALYDRLLDSTSEDLNGRFRFLSVV